MVGDLENFVFRLRTVLPKRWFGEQSPNLNAIIAGLATPWAWLYSLLSYVAQQARITTAVGTWLDLAAADYFGETLRRKPNEADTIYGTRIKKALLREAGTRRALKVFVLDICGSEPRIFEPAYCSDTGAYGAFTPGAGCPCFGLAYGVTGGWGNLNLPYQFFISIKRPASPGVAMLAGYGISTGAFGSGSISYVDLAQLPGQVTDEDIRSGLLCLLPVNAVAWLQIL
jgi:hypothetical protein